MTFTDKQAITYLSTASTHPLDWQAQADIASLVWDGDDLREVLAEMDEEHGDTLWRGYSDGFSVEIQAVAELVHDMRRGLANRGRDDDQFDTGALAVMVEACCTKYGFERSELDAALRHVAEMDATSFTGH